MKFRRLTIYNIASIEQAEIDFDREPLASADVFLISGVTGAGKSTILDTICLALFNAVPRLGTGRSADRFNGISSRDYKQLLRTGAKEGYAELSFRGNNNREYVARWRVWLTAKKINSQWTLIPDGDAAKALVKEKLIESEISAALNIDYEQFVRTSLLAQGEFTRFLNSDDAEKAKILARLTGVGRFAEVGREIYRIYAYKLSSEQTLRDQSQVVQLLSEEQIAAIKTEKDSLAVQVEQQSAELRAIDARLQWLLRNAELQGHFAAAEAAVRAAREVRDGEHIAAERRLVADYDATAAVRRNMSGADDARLRMGGIDGELGALLPKWQLILASVDALRARSEASALELAKTDTAMAAYAVCVESFGHYGDIIAVAEGVLRERAEYGRLTAEVERVRSSLPVAKKNLAEADEALKVLVADAGNKERSAAEAQNRFSALDSGAVLAELTAARDRLQSFRTLVQLAALASEASVAAAEADALARRAERSRRLFDEIDMGHKEWASVARATLTKGCTCPVCRQTVAELPPVEDVLNRQWLAAKAALDDDEKALAEARRRCSETDARMTVLRRSHEQIGSRLESVPESEDGREAMLLELRSALGTAEKANEAAASLKARTEAAQNAHLEALKKRENGEKRRAEALAALQTVEMRVAALEESMARAAANADAALSALQGREDMKPWFSAGVPEPADFLKDFKESYCEYERLRALRQKLVSAIERASEQLAVAKDAGEALADALPEWAHVPAATHVSEADVFAYIGSFVSKVCSLADRRRQLALEVGRLDMAVAHFLEENDMFTKDILLSLNCMAEADVERRRAALVGADTAVTRADAAFESAKTQLETHGKTRPEGIDTDSRDSLGERKRELEELIAQHNRALGALVQQLEGDGKMRLQQADLLDRLAVAEKESGRWARLNNLFGDKEGCRFRNIALSFVLENLLIAANRYLAMLTDRYRLKGVEGSYLILLEDAYNGYRSRPVATSSGGESFMVSLALALALADLGGSFVADTLFIDEGFGTLSGEPLQRAVGMLRSLNRSSGRRVGIISHIAELKAELPVQIHVDADPSRGASTVSVTGAL